MRQLLKKIPITFWTLVLIFITCYFISINYFPINDNKLDNVTKILTIIGIYFLAVQVRNQTKSERISTEFLNQANFEFKGFCAKTIKNASPRLCSEPGTLNYNECSDTHWFDFAQTGNLPPKDIKISLFHKGEEKDISELLKSRTQYEPIVYANDDHQFKLPQQAVTLVHFNPKQNGKFFILLEYKSIYTNIKYKRIYHLCYAPTITPDAVPTTWLNSIKYYSLSLAHIIDSDTITWKEILKNFWNRFLRKIYIKKELDIQDWLIDL